MSSVLSELCKNLEENTNKLEEELKRNIANCHKLLIDKKATETKLSLEKAKDYHYKEVLNILKDIVSNLKKLVFHEAKIRKLDSENNFSPDELKRYSYVQRQVQVFSQAEDVVTKREKRRVASEISVDSLEAWELYLEHKAEEERVIKIDQTSIPKRKAKSSRRRKKFVSSTFNNFLDGKNEIGVLHSISETDPVSEFETEDDYVEMCKAESADEIENATYPYERRMDGSSTSLSSIYESEADDESFKDSNEDLNLNHNLSTLDILESLNQEHNFNIVQERARPKVVEVVYKKNEN